MQLSVQKNYKIKALSVKGVYFEIKEKNYFIDALSLKEIEEY